MFVPEQIVYSHVLPVESSHVRTIYLYKYIKRSIEPLDNVTAKNKIHSKKKKPCGGYFMS